MILGIDPSLTKTGWGLVKYENNKLHYINSGLIKTNSKDPISIRLSIIANNVENILLNHDIEHVAIEKTFININPTSSLKLAYVRGAILAIFGKFNKKTYEYDPNYIKKSIGSYGHSQKNQIIYMMYMLLSNLNKDVKITEDEADALAICYTCFTSNKF